MGCLEKKSHKNDAKNAINLTEMISYHVEKKKA